MEHGSALFSFNLTEREDWLMRHHTRPYFCTRLSALFVLALAIVPSWRALEMVGGWLVHIGLLRVPGGAVGAYGIDGDMVAVYTMFAMLALVLLWLAWELWMFHVRAWWLAMLAILLAALYCLFVTLNLLLLLVFGAVYALLMLSYPIFAERLGDS